MNRDPNTLTNLLLVAVIALLLVSMAVPALRDEAPAPTTTAPTLSRDPEVSDLVARVELLLRKTSEPAAVPVAPSDENEVVVRIPGKLAEDLGLTAADVRTVIEGLARVAKKTGQGRRSANETAAIATLRNCCSAQAQFQATAKADLDRDGTGEFGGFVEMSGAKEVRGQAALGRMIPPVLSRAFSTPSSRGFVSRSGYYYVIYLPDAAGDGVAVDGVGFNSVDPDQAEKRWCMYAWPVKYGATGTKTYMMSHTGDVLAADAREYTGENAPLPGAAFAGGGRESIVGQPANGRQGQDGHEWKQVN